MKNHKRTEEQQKDYIFDIFSECRSETVSDRRQVYYPILCEQIYKWHRDYLLIDVDERGLEIANVIKRFLEDDKKVPRDKSGFFKYLHTSLKNEIANSHRVYNENDTIKIPKEKKRKLREVEDYIRMQESQLGRKLTATECTKGISEFFKNQKYVDLLKVLNVGSLSYTSNDGNDEIDTLNYAETLSDDPLDEYLSKYGLEKVRKAIMAVLSKRQKRAIACNKALFTLHCIKKHFLGLYPVLDQDVIDSFHREEKKLTQYEIYQKYHPKADRNSADALASKLLREFNNDLNAYLAEKNP